MILLNLWDDFVIPGLIKICMGIMGLVKSLLNLIFDIANITFFRDDIISDLFNRVYIIVGVLMLFKITISCVQYLVNPDKMDDKESGFGGIAKRAIIAVLLLAFVPTIFSFAKTAQGAILEALPKVILGQEMSYDVDDMGESIAYTTTLSFFGYTSDSCNDGSIDGISGGSSNSKFSSIEDIKNNRHEITSATCNGEKRYDFNLILGIPASLFLVVILVSMVLDVGVRVIKFGFLEIIAPIPIASYIDPKTSKKSFDSWVHNCISVYTDLFIRLGVIYLILYLFMILLPSFSTSFKLNDGTVLSWGRSMLVNAAIIIALFMFAKNAPKFISDVLGIKGDGNIGDMFKRASGFAGAGLGMATAGFSNAFNGVKTGKGVWGKTGGAVGSALRGALSAGVSGGRAALNGKGFKEGFAGHKHAITARQNRELEKMQGVKFSQRMKAKAYDFMGIDSDASLADAQIKAHDEINSSIGKLKGDWNEMLEKYGGSIDIMKNVKLKTSLKSVLQNEASNIRASGNINAINIMNDVMSGKTVTYHQLLALKDAAQTTKGLESLGRTLSDKSATFKTMQSFLWNDGMHGGVKDRNGVSIDELTYGNAKFDPTLSRDVENIHRIISTNSVQLGNIVDDNGNVIYDRDHLFEGFYSNFKAFDDAVLRAGNRIKATNAEDKFAAARAANERRNANKDKK